MYNFVCLSKSEELTITIVAQFCFWEELEEFFSIFTSVKVYKYSSSDPVNTSNYSQPRNEILNTKYHRHKPHLSWPWERQARSYFSLLFFVCCVLCGVVSSRTRLSIEWRVIRIQILLLSWRQAAAGPSGILLTRLVLERITGLLTCHPAPPQHFPITVTTQFTFLTVGIFKIANRFLSAGRNMPFRSVIFIFHQFSSSPHISICCCPKIFCQFSNYKSNLFS